MRHNIKPKTIDGSRSVDSDCCLCDVSKATKENSHIVPKFMTKSLLGESNKKQAFKIDSGKTYNSPSVSQDTAKQDFILCDACEQYFSVLETYMATRLHNRIRSIHFASQFTTMQNDGGITWKVCNYIDSRIFRLFLYSIIWRCAISTSDIYKEFNLEPDELKQLKNALFASKCATQSELLTNIDQTTAQMLLFPFVFFTADSFADKTSNVVAANPFAKNPYQLILNEYMLIFSFDGNNEQQLFDFLNNSDNSPIKVGFFSQDLWESLRTQFLKMVVKNSIGHLEKTKRTPWFMDTSKDEQ